MEMRILTILFFLMLIMTSCSKEIKIEEGQLENQLVVEGYIENGKYPKIYLTKSTKYFTKIDSSNFMQILANFAKVSVSDGNETEILTLMKGKKTFPLFYFEGSEIKGEIGKEYQIKIEIEGKTYESTTTITKPIDILSLTYFSKPNNPNYNFLNLKFKDPIEEKNYYKIYTKRIGKDLDFKPCYLSTFNDFGFNGKTYDFEILSSYSPVVDSDEDRYFVKGDSVIVKLCTMEKKNHESWKNIEAQIAISANPFGLSNNNPNSLISNNALGTWCGMGTSYAIIKVK